MFRCLDSHRTLSRVGRIGERVAEAASPEGVPVVNHVEFCLLPVDEWARDHFGIPALFGNVDSGQFTHSGPRNAVAGFSIPDSITVCFVGAIVIAPARKENHMR